MPRFNVNDRVRTDEPLFPMEGYVFLVDREEVVIETDDGHHVTKTEMELSLVRPACPFKGRGRCEDCE